MPSFTTPFTAVPGNVVKSAENNSGARDNIQYLFNILNAVQAQTGGVGLQQSSDANGQGLNVFNNAKTTNADVWTDGTYIYLQAGTGGQHYIRVNISTGDITFDGGTLAGVAWPPTPTVVTQSTDSSGFGSASNTYNPYFSASVTSGKKYLCFAYLPALTSADGSNRHKGYLYVARPDHSAVGNAFGYGEAGTGANTNNLYAWGTITANASTIECGFFQQSGSGAGTAVMSSTVNGTNVGASLTVVQVG